MLGGFRRNATKGDVTVVLHFASPIYERKNIKSFSLRLIAFNHLISAKRRKQSLDSSQLLPVQAFTNTGRAVIPFTSSRLDHSSRCNF